MIIQIRQADIQDTLVSVSGSVALKMPDEFDLLEPAIFNGSCLCLGDGLFLIHGTLIFRVKTQCARCAKPVDITLTVPFEERFARDDKDNGDEDMYLYIGNEIDLEEAMNEAAYMALPLRVLCRDDCKGLCPVCGADKNENECGCELVAENAFSLLKQYDFSEEV